jgi:hypothetical protein
MWEAIIKWIESRSYRCDHNYELIMQDKLYENHKSKMPHAEIFAYRCTKCCDFKTKRV